jgi:hypothetical protein
MEITVYILFSIFCFLTYYLSHTIQTRDMKVLKLVSGALLIGLGFSTLALTYIIPMSTDYGYVTKMEQGWQLALAGVYATLGFFNIIFAINDIILGRKNEVG